MSFWKGKKVIVTGGAGFLLGEDTVRDFAKGARTYLSLGARRMICGRPVPLHKYSK
jgi:hypothetical protein